MHQIIPACITQSCSLSGHLIWIKILYQYLHKLCYVLWCDTSFIPPLKKKKILIKPVTLSRFHSRSLPEYKINKWQRLACDTIYSMLHEESIYILLYGNMMVRWQILSTLSKPYFLLTPTNWGILYKCE